jgi:hypothetical protein
MMKPPRRAGERPVRRCEIENGVESWLDIFRPPPLQGPTPRLFSEIPDALAQPTGIPARRWIRR